MDDRTLTLDLPDPAPARAPSVAAPAMAAPAAAAAPKRGQVFAGFTVPQLILGAAILGLLIWGMWVTRALTAAPQQHIVKANLSRIVGDYVQAQARSATPPAQVQAQMQQFMVALDSELQRRSAKGQVVLVGEAVLSKTVPDITGEVSNAVYAGGIARPQPAAAVPAVPMIQPVPVAPVAAAPVAPVPAGNPFAGAAPTGETPSDVPNGGPYAPGAQ